jgi:putative ABC transport system permease protein
MVELAGRNLRQAGLRNSLTTLGISVGVASLVAMLSLGIGLQLLFRRELGRSSLFDSVFVTSRQDFRPRRGAENKPSKPLDDSARKEFSRITSVIEVYPSLAAVGEFQFEDSKPGDSHFTVMTGLPPSARNGESFDAVQGRFFSGAMVPEAVIMADFGRELLGLPEEPLNSDKKLTNDQANSLLGKRLVLRYAERQSQTTVAASPQPASAQPASAQPASAQPASAQPASAQPARAQPASAQPASAPAEASSAGDDSSAFNVVRRELPLKIVGIVNQEPVRGIPRSGRTWVFLPVAFAESLNMIQPGDLRNIMRPGEGKTYQALIVHVVRSRDVNGVEDQIKKQGFATFSLLDASRNVRIVFIFVDLFLGIFGSLALVVASLGIVNTLVMAILERRREIGIMKALGASDSDVKWIFSVEAACMGLFGGALGVIIGWAIGRVIDMGTSIYLQRQDIKPETFWHVPWWLVFSALGISVALSWVAGLYPAARAAKLDPVHALRHD